MECCESKIRVLVEDVEEIYSEGILQTIKSKNNVQFLGNISFNDEVLNTMRINEPDIFITSSTELPTWTQYINSIAKTLPNISILAICPSHNIFTIYKIVRTGIRVCILRNSHKNDLVSAVDALLTSKEFYSFPIRKLMARMIAGKENIQHHLDQFIKLTEKDKRFLTLLCQELTMKQIACKMEVSVNSLEHRKKRLLTLLDKNTIAGLINYSIVSGLFNPYIF